MKKTITRILTIEEVCDRCEKPFSVENPRYKDGQHELCFIVGEWLKEDNDVN